MGKAKKSPTKTDLKPLKPASTPEARESQLVSLAMNLAEQQLRDGTASAQVITHYLKLGSTKDHIEREILQEQQKLVRAKTESLESAKRVEALYADALKAMREYSGREEDEDDTYI